MSILATIIDGWPVIVCAFVFGGQWAQLNYRLGGIENRLKKLEEK